jgi:hypothetical protein
MGLKVKVVAVTGTVKATLCSNSGNVEYKISLLVRQNEPMVTFHVFTSF